MARALFYLPTVTPWWFGNVVGPMIRAVADAAEVHVLVPPLWRNTGVGAEELISCSDAQDVNWHIADGEAHASLRTSPTDPAEIIAFVRSLEPDYVFCRSADIATPAHFPGKVRHLLEAGAPPFSTHPSWIILQQDFWHHGSLPRMTDLDRQTVEQLFQSIWNQARDRAEHQDTARGDRACALESLGLRSDRKIIALPLEYEHEEVFTSFHNRFARNLDLIEHVAEHLPRDFVLAITDHPLNYRHVDNHKVYDAIAALGERAHLVPNPDASNAPTDLLIEAADGLIVQNTKAIYSGAFHGKPILRFSNRPTADWIGAQVEMGAFTAAVRSGRRGVAEEEARLWFGTHLLHETIDPAATSGEEILDRVDRPFARERLQGGLQRLQHHQRQSDLVA